jgi:hypothetical protein
MQAMPHSTPDVFAELFEPASMPIIISDQRYLALFEGLPSDFTELGHTPWSICQMAREPNPAVAAAKSALQAPCNGENRLAAMTT